MIKKIFSLCGIVLLLSSCGSSQSEKKTEEDVPGEEAVLTLSKSDGYSLKFNNIKADHYIVYDSNDYRDEIRIDGNSKDEYFYYTPEVVGNHDVFVKAFDKNNKLITFSKHIDSVEIEPVYSYIPFSEYYCCTEKLLSKINIPHSLWEAAETRFGHKEKHYFFLDDNFNWTIDGSYNTENYLEKGECANFSKNQNILDKIFKNLKDSGNNVIYISSMLNAVEQNPGWCWWFLSSNDNNLIRFMDAAWKYGLKCIIRDRAMFSVCSRSNDKFVGNKQALKAEVQSVVESRFLHKNSKESNLMYFLKHKAFYGFDFQDEPFPDSETMYAIGYACEKINELYQSDINLKKWNKPVFFTCCLPYADSIFDSKEEYANYIKQWVSFTGTDYINFDLYTYTTMSYGIRAGQYFCNAKIAFEAIDEVRKQIPNFKVTQTINGGNAPERMYQTYADIYASHLLTLAMKFNGYGTFIFSPFDTVGVWDNPIVNHKQERSDFFDFFVDANKQVIIGKGLLDGYKVESIKINQNPANGYGYGKKELIVNFINGEKKAIMYVNYETDVTRDEDVSISKNVEKGHDYYIFGKGQSTVRNNRKTDQTIKLEKAEALLVF